MLSKDKPTRRRFLSSAVFTTGAAFLGVGAVRLSAAEQGNTSAPGQTAAHPDSARWPNLLNESLSDAIAPPGVWSFADDVLTASKDETLWTQKEYENFVLDLEFKTAVGTNSGVFVYGSDLKNWIPNSVEIQIADDFAEKWAKWPKTWRCGAIFGHLAPTRSVVRKPGEWNRMTVTCKGPQIDVVLNSVRVVVAADLRQWISAKVNPDGSPVPAWLSKPLAELPTRGHIGLQGKHAGAPIYFRNLRIKEA
jgi:hypothetical protein